MSQRKTATAPAVVNEPKAKRGSVRKAKPDAAVATKPTSVVLCKDLEIDTDRTLAILESYLESYLDDSGFNGYVIGITGGVDSAVTAAIAKRAVGADRVRLFCLPYKNNKQSIKDAQIVAHWLDLKLDVLDITKMVDAYFLNIRVISPIRVGNKMARERMSILFDQAFDARLLPLGFVNRTEMALGYFTWFGDGGCSISLLGQLYKTQVRQLAVALKVPQYIRDKAPSADLWEGQTDEDELGFSYDEIDRFLYLVLDQGVRSRAELAKAGFDGAFADRALELVNRYFFKRRCPSVPSLGRSEVPDHIKLKK